MTERHVTDCWDCPFAEKEHWSNEDDSGTDINGCELGTPADLPPWQARRVMGTEKPPFWCKLREAAVLVSLRAK